MPTSSNLTNQDADNFTKALAPAPPTLAEYAEAKNLPEEYLRNIWGLRDVADGMAMPYRNPDGSLFREKVRLTLSHDVKPLMKWHGDSPTDVRTLPYGLDNIPSNTPEVLLCEGESDTQTASFHNIYALGISGAQGWHDEFAKLPAFADAKTIYVVQEPGPGGKQFVAKLANSPLRAKLKVVTLPFKDISELHLQNSETLSFRASLKEATDVATPLPPASVGTKPATVPNGTKRDRNANKLADYLNKAGIKAKRENYLGGYKFILTPCPFDRAHRGTSAAAFVWPDGALGFKCQHKSCQGKSWKQFRTHLEEKLGEPLVLEESIGPTPAEPSLNAVEEYETATAAVLEYPAMGDDLISQYARLLTEGTGVPFGHVRECLKNFLAFCLSDDTRYPNHESLYLRGWHFNLGEPESGKTTALTFVMDRWSHVLTDLGIRIDKLSSYGSLQYLTKGFEDHPRMLLHVTEGNTLATANEHVAAIFGGLADLYDQPMISAGSYRNKSARCVNAKGSCIICFTPDDFLKGLQGKGVIGGGVLPRWTMSYSDKIHVEGDWSSPPEAALRMLEQKMMDRFTGVDVVETPEARTVRFALTAEMERPEAGRHGKRLIEHYKRECLLAAVFGDGSARPGVITKDVAEWAASWTRYQLHLRITYWPIDAGNDVERMCTAMRGLLHRADPKAVSLKQLKDAANVYREGSGGIDAFGRAHRAMMMNQEMCKVGQNRRGKDLFALVAD